MNKELKRLVIEIVTLFLILIVTVPICVSASNRYQKEILLTGIDTSVDISNYGEYKKITIYSNYDEKVRVPLTLKISKLENQYSLYFDGEEFSFDDFESQEDEEYRYYYLGIYEVKGSREFDFKIHVVGQTYYSETITYCFITNGELWNR